MTKKSNFNKFLTLLEKEFYRNLKLVIPLILILFMGHLVMAWNRISSMQEIVDIRLKSNTVDELLRIREYFGFNYFFNGNDDIIIFMFLSILIITLYTLILWNQEWMGGSKSIYTLLSLPIKKSYIVCSKVITMLIFILFNLLVQILALFIDKGIIKLRVNSAFYVDESVLGIFSTNYDVQFINLISKEFWVSLITIISVILLLGLIVLLFRSFKVKGLILGVTMLVLYVSIYVGTYYYFHLYYNEYYGFKVIFSLIITILTFSYSKYLLEKKVTV